jgi:aspartyl-tRNA(Asn)/glutamyl-tRNA(Gln) amidotransferase subunit A
MEKQQIPYLTASQLSGLIASKEVSPVEAVEAYLDRIDIWNDKLHAYLTVCREEALAAARESEQALVRGEYQGPMHGIPVAVKDQVNSRGIRTTYGSPIFNDVIPDEDATVLANLKSAGAILLGKLNMTEFGTTGFSHQFETPRNPWNLERYTGGSSSGSGAATAGFLCATSLGEDTGGSVRFPATWCGLVGIRPTWGRVSRYGVRPGLWSMDAIGPISRTVEDCAMTLRAIAGQDPKDSYTSSRPVPDYVKELGADIKGLRVGILKELLDDEAVDPEVRDAVIKATGVLGELGASVEEVSVPLSVHSPTVSGALRVEAPTNYRDLVRNRLQEIGHDNRIGYLIGSVLPAQAFYKAQKLRTMIRQQVLEALEKVDVLVLPTTRVAAQELRPDPVVDSKEKNTRSQILGSSVMLTTTFSLANIPALTVPCGFTSENLPIGLQIGGRLFAEETVFQVAHAYEQATPWHTMKPDV